MILIYGFYYISRAGYCTHVISMYGVYLVIGLITTHVISLYGVYLIRLVITRVIPIYGFYIAEGLVNTNVISIYGFHLFETHGDAEANSNRTFNLQLIHRRRAIRNTSKNIVIVKGELNPKIDVSSFEHLGIVEQLYEVFLSC